MKKSKHPLSMFFNRYGLCVDSSPYTGDAVLYARIADAVESAVRFVFGPKSCEHSRGKSIWIVAKATPTQAERLRDFIEMNAGDFLEVAYKAPADVPEKKSTGEELEETKRALAAKIRRNEAFCDRINDDFLKPRRAKIRAWKKQLVSLS